MNNNTIYKLFPEPVFKYKLENSKNIRNDVDDKAHSRRYVKRVFGHVFVI